MMAVWGRIARLLWLMRLCWQLASLRKGVVEIAWQAAHADKSSFKDTLVECHRKSCKHSCVAPRVHVVRMSPQYTCRAGRWTAFAPPAETHRLVDRAAVIVLFFPVLLLRTIAFHQEQRQGRKHSCCHHPAGNSACQAGYAVVATRARAGWWWRRIIRWCRWHGDNGRYVAGRGWLGRRLIGWGACL